MNESKALEKMRKAHEFRMKKLRLSGELKVEENNVKNEITLNKLTSEKDQMSIIGKIKELKLLVKQDKILQRAGKYIEFWGTIGILISTLLTIAGLWDFFNTSYLKIVSFVAGIVLVQFTIFILSKQDSTIKQHFRQHAFKVAALKLVLISISIYGNFTFFTEGREISFIEGLTTLALCICIDVISIYAISIAHDFKTLNKNVSSDSMYKGLFGKVIYNSTYKLVSNIENKYLENKSRSAIEVKVLENDENIKKLPEFVQEKDVNKNLDLKQDTKLLKSSDFVPEKDTELKSNYNKDLENDIEEKNDSKFVQDKSTENELTYKQDSKIKSISEFVQEKNINKVKNAILSYKDDNICPSVSALEIFTGLPKNTIAEIKKILEDEGLIKTDGLKTLVLEG